MDQVNLKILFEDQGEKYLEKYRKKILEVVSEKDFEVIKEMDEPERTVTVFEILFTIPFEKGDDYSEVIPILAEEFLPYDVEAAYKNGKLMLTIDGKNHSFEGLADYEIMRKFNELIAPQFELRIMTISLLDADNVHSGLILSTEEWTALEKQYGGKVGEIFIGISEMFFDDDIEEDEYDDDLDDDDDDDDFEDEDEDEDFDEDDDDDFDEDDDDFDEDDDDFDDDDDDDDDSDDEDDDSEDEK